jgi:undecaprenyl-diphosphatase
MDRAVLLWMVAHRSGWATGSARALMALGTRPIPVAGLAVGALVLVGVTRSWRLGATAAVAAVAAVALSMAAKAVVHRPRPAWPLSLVGVRGPSMPSTDAALTAAAATVLVIAALRTGHVAGRLLAAAVAAVVLVVGVALVYLGAHWTTDVLVGWALGAAVGTALVRAEALRCAGPETSGRR